MKRFVAALLALLLVCCCCVGYAETDLSVMTDEELVSLRTRIDVELAARATGNAGAENLGKCEYKGMTITLTGYKLDTNRDGLPVVVFFYDFANTSDEAGNFNNNALVTVFQNGMECEYVNIPHVAVLSDNVTAIKSGASVHCEKEFILYDTTAPLEVTVGFRYDYSKTAAFTIVIPLAE